MFGIGLEKNLKRRRLQGEIREKKKVNKVRQLVLAAGTVATFYDCFFYDLIVILYGSFKSLFDSSLNRNAFVTTCLAQLNYITSKLASFQMHRTH